VAVVVAALKVVPKGTLTQALTPARAGNNLIGLVLKDEKTAAVLEKAPLLVDGHTVHLTRSGQPPTKDHVMVRVFDLPAGFTVPMVKTDLSATYGEGNVLRVMPEHLRDQDGNKLPVLSSTAVVHLAADTAPASRAKVGGVTVRISDARIRSKTATTPPPAPANAAAAPAPAKTTTAPASAAAQAPPTDEALAAQLQQQEDEEQRRRDAQQAKDAELARQLHNHEAAADATQPTEEPFTMVTTKKGKKGVFFLLERSTRSHGLEDTNAPSRWHLLSADADVATTHGHARLDWLEPQPRLCLRHHCHQGQARRWPCRWHPHPHQRRLARQDPRHARCSPRCPAGTCCACRECECAHRR
jgi:hypothetical protein